MITVEQIEVAKSGQRVTLCDGGVELVLMRRDHFEQLARSYDDSELADDEMSALAARAFEDADRAGPIE